MQAGSQCYICKLLIVCCTNFALLLCSLCFILRACLKSCWWVAVHVRLVESIRQPLGPHLLSLNVDPHAGVDVQYRRISTEWTTFWHQTGTQQHNRSLVCSTAEYIDKGTQNYIRWLADTSMFSLLPRFNAVQTAQYCLFHTASI